ncbi:TraB/GumN family protein [Rhodobacteraceae bacterium KMM 6894]|nr:TraB/GumN family protein [Rhodobacteraceae bacterium KMM 6894]
MRAILALTLCLTTCLLPLTARAQVQCDGTDTIAALPEGERAALIAAAATQPYPEGLLWQATRGDTRITLFGTYHFAHHRTDAHLTALKPLIDAADQVFLEVSNDDLKALERRMATDPSVLFITDGPTLPDLLGDDDWQALSSEMSKRGFPGFMTAKFKPIWASMMLGIGPCEARAGVTGIEGIDKRIGTYAADTGKISQSLEDAGTLLSLLDDIPLEQQLDAIRLFLDWDGNPDDIAYTLRERYLAGQTALIWEYSRKISIEDAGPTAEQDFALFERLLLNDRNQDWADVLSAENLTGNSLVAVGAAHLPGQMGVLTLLEQRGFAITRLPFDP